MILTLKHTPEYTLRICLLLSYYSHNAAYNVYLKLSRTGSGSGSGPKLFARSDPDPDPTGLGHIRPSLDSYVCCIYGRAKGKLSLGVGFKPLDPRKQLNLNL